MATDAEGVLLRLGQLLVAQGGAGGETAPTATEQRAQLIESWKEHMDGTELNDKSTAALFPELKSQRKSHENISKDKGVTDLMKSENIEKTAEDLRGFIQSIQDAYLDPTASFIIETSSYWEYLHGHSEMKECISKFIIDIVIHLQEQDINPAELKGFKTGDTDIPPSIEHLPHHLTNAAGEQIEFASAKPVLKKKVGNKTAESTYKMIFHDENLPYNDPHSYPIFTVVGPWLSEVVQMKLDALKEEKKWTPMEERVPGSKAFVGDGTGHLDLDTFVACDNAICGHMQQAILSYLKLYMKDQEFDFRQICKLIQRARFDCKSYLVKQYALTFLCGLNELVVNSVSLHQSTASLKYWPGDHIENYLTHQLQSMQLIGRFTQVSPPHIPDDRHLIKVVTEVAKRVTTANWKAQRPNEEPTDGTAAIIRVASNLREWVKHQKRDPKSLEKLNTGCPGLAVATRSLSALLQFIRSQSRSKGDIPVRRPDHFIVREGSTELREFEDIRTEFVDDQNSLFFVDQHAPCQNKLGNTDDEEIVLYHVDTEDATAAGEFLQLVQHGESIVRDQLGDQFDATVAFAANCWTRIDQETVFMANKNRNAKRIKNFKNKRNPYSTPSAVPSLKSTSTFAQGPPKVVDFRSRHMATLGPFHNAAKAKAGYFANFAKAKQHVSDMRHNFDPTKPPIMPSPSRITDSALKTAARPPREATDETRAAGLKLASAVYLFCRQNKFNIPEDAIKALNAAQREYFVLAKRSGGGVNFVDIDTQLLQAMDADARRDEANIHALNSEESIPLFGLDRVCEINSAGGDSMIDLISCRPPDFEPDFC